MPKFSDSPYFLLLEYLQILSDPTEPAEQVYNGASLTDSYLGMPYNIIVDGGSFVDFYVKDEEYGFRPIRLTPVYGEPKEKIYFKFEDPEKEVLITGTSITETLSGTETVSGFYTYEFDLYDYTYEVEIDPDDHVAQEIYFRKNSPFYEGLENSAYSYLLNKGNEKFTIRNYINTDKNFLYFGQIYPADKG